MLTRRTKLLLIALPVVVVLAVMQMHRNHTAPLVHGDLEIHSLWSRATAPGAPGVAYLTVSNTGGQPERLVSVSSDIADAALHTMTMQEGVMKMRNLENGKEIPSGATVEFTPKADHVMLMNLKKPLEVGERIKLTLQFEKAGPFAVDVTVGAADADSATDHSGH